MKNISRLLDLIETLRGENGCPWDKKQTPASIARHLSEEVYELMDALESDDDDHVCDELGDVLFLTLFVASFYKEAGSFDIEDAAAASVAKMTRRHPHIFGDVTLETPEQVLKQWAKIKQTEKKPGETDYIADSVAMSMPSLARAHRLSERVGAAGFDWDDISGPMEKVKEEWGEFCAELITNPSEQNAEENAEQNAEGGADGNTDGGKTRIEKAREKAKEKATLEFGDILFSLVNVARFAKIDPEAALAASNRKFSRRFTFMEKSFLKTGEKIQTVSKRRLHERWEEAKEND